MKEQSILNIEQGFYNVLSDTREEYGSTHTGPMLYLLALLTKAKYILEIGVGLGTTAYWLANAARENGGKYYGIEKNSKQCGNVNRQFGAYDLPGFVYCMDSNNLDHKFFENEFARIDVALLDGDHTQRAILHEMELVFPLLRSDGKGFIFIHDVTSIKSTHSKKGWDFVKRQYADLCEYIELPYRLGMGVLRKL